tara:strand:- start:10402 stop:11358 length:957 start_codon:yes stop_codon:yes gene_type:complete
MNFFDRKEEVLELKLTSYGKSLLSRGEFNPTHYAFFDDDIIYDSQYVSDGTDSQIEHSTKSSDRIRKAIRPKVQYNYAGAETHIKKLHGMSYTTPDNGTNINASVPKELSLEQKLKALENPPPAADNHYSMGLPMGSSKLNSDKVPAWDAKFIKGEILTPITDYTGSSGLLKIPQLDVVVYYDITTNQFVGEETPNVAEGITVFPDNSYLQVEKDCVLVDLREFNSLFDNENFEIEVYKTVGEELNLDTPLLFADAKKVTNDVYYSENTKSTIDVGEGHVEYYFDIRVDDEISDDVGLGGNVITDIYKTKPENDKEPC